MREPTRMWRPTSAWASIRLVGPMRRLFAPYVLYWMYGDTRLIERHFDAMARYVRFLKETSEDLIRPATGFGDWLSLNADTPKEVISTAYFAHVANLLSEMRK